MLYCRFTVMGVEIENEGGRSLLSVFRYPEPSGSKHILCPLILVLILQTSAGVTHCNIENGATTWGFILDQATLP